MGKREFGSIDELCAELGLGELVVCEESRLGLSCIVFYDYWEARWLLLEGQAAFDEYMEARFAQRDERKARARAMGGSPVRRA